MKVYSQVILAVWLGLCLASPDQGFHEEDYRLTRPGHVDLLRTVHPIPRGGRSFAPSGVLATPNVVRANRVHFSESTVDLRAPSGSHHSTPTSSSRGHNTHASRAQSQGYSRGHSPPATRAPSQDYSRGHSPPASRAPSQGYSMGHSPPATRVPSQGYSRGHSPPASRAPSQGYSAPSGTPDHPQSSMGSFHEGVFTQIYGPANQDLMPTTKPEARPVSRYVPPTYIPPTYIPPTYVPRTPTYAPPSDVYLPPSNVHSQPSNPTKPHATPAVSGDSSNEGPSAEMYFNLGDAFNYDVAPVSGGGPGLQKTHRMTPKVMVTSRRPKQGYQAPKATPSTGKPTSSNDKSDYSYHYDVKSNPTIDSYGGKQEGPNFGHAEKRSGYRTEGRYYVKLPDGRTQIVDYYADETGYHPTVTYA